MQPAGAPGSEPSPIRAEYLGDFRVSGLEGLGCAGFRGFRLY